jgi:hypothetical protein
MVATAVGVATVAGGVYGASQSKKAANKAADAQSEASQAGIDEQRRQFDKVQELLSPYVKAGTGSLAAQQNLIGLNGAKAQQAAIDALRASPAYTSAMRSGTDTINANASATGGLRGGNTQEALGRFGGDLLTNLVQSQFSNLGGLTNLGQNSAAQTGSAAMSSGNNIAGLLQQQGAAQAGGYIATGNANSQIANSLTSGLGAFLGAGGKF